MSMIRILACLPCFFHPPNPGVPESCSRRSMRQPFDRNPQSRAMLRDQGPAQRQGRGVKTHSRSCSMTPKIHRCSDCRRNGESRRPSVFVQYLLLVPPLWLYLLKVLLWKNFMFHRSSVSFLSACSFKGWLSDNSSWHHFQNCMGGKLSTELHSLLFLLLLCPSLSHRTLVSFPYHQPIPFSDRYKAIHLIFRLASGLCCSCFLSVAGGTMSDMFDDNDVAT
jgi:hypothetical protein